MGDLGVSNLISTHRLVTLAWYASGGRRPGSGAGGPSEGPILPNRVPARTLLDSLKDASFVDHLRSMGLSYCLPSRHGRLGVRSCA